jgi:hypothetical protein
MFVPYGKSASGKPRIENLACLLLEQGLAYVHEYSASQSRYAKELMSAEEKAKSSSLRVLVAQVLRSYIYLNLTIGLDSHCESGSRRAGNF